MRRSVLPLHQDTSSLNLSTLSLPPVPKDPLPEALPCLLRLPLQVLRSTFTRLVRPDARPWVRVGRVWRGVRRRRLGAAVKEWRLQAGISGLVRKVNVDLSFIRGFDRLDVFVRCKLQFFLQFCLCSLSRAPRRFSYVETSRFSRSLSKIMTRRAFRRLQIPARLAEATSALLLLCLRCHFHHFHSQIRTLTHFQASLSQFASIVSHKALLAKGKAFALLWGLDMHRKGLSTAASVRSSPDKSRRSMVLWGVCWHFGAVVSGIFAKNKRFAMNKLGKYRQKSAPEVAKLVQFAVILGRKANTRLNAATFAIKTANYKEKVNFLSSALQNSIKSTNISLYSTAWQRLLTHYEAAVERRQGIEGIKSVFEEILSRKSLQRAWNRLKFQTEIKQMKGKMLIKYLNCAVERRKRTYLRETVEKLGKMNFLAVRNAFLVLNFVIKRQFQTVFRQFEGLKRFSPLHNSDSSQFQWAFSLPQQTLSRLTAVLAQFTAKQRLRSLLHWRFLSQPCASRSHLLCGLLRRCTVRRERTAFGRLQAYSSAVEVESGLVCLDFSVEAVIRPKWKAQVREAWGLLRSFAGHDKPRAKGESWAILMWSRKVLENRLRAALHTIKKQAKRSQKSKNKAVKTLFSIISLKSKQRQAVSFTLLKERTNSPASTKLFLLLSACLSTRLAQGLSSIQLFSQPKPRPKLAGLHYLYRLLSTPTARVLAYSFRQIRVYAYNEARYRTYLNASPLLSRSMFAGSIRNEEIHRKSPEFGSSARPLRTLTTSLL